MFFKKSTFNRKCFFYICYMINLNITNETSRLRSVVIGIADSNGAIPKLEDTYDPKSAEHIKSGTYPKETDMVKEIESLYQVFKKYDVKVYRPDKIIGYNQIFSRDIAFVIDDKMIISNILPNRDKEIEAIQYLCSQIDENKIIFLPKEAHVEGGDVMPWNDYVFVGTYRGNDYEDFITARTNMIAVKCLEDLFPTKKIVSFNLRKSNTIARDNALHLDCCFQPLGNGKALIHDQGFLNKTDYEWLLNFFGKDNVFVATQQEMTQMNCNVFSISEDVVISEQNFTRLNTWLVAQGFTVEEVPYAEISKQGGLLRCSTLPLNRN